jgi:2-dehydropantoate 2-reductase
MSNNSPLKIAVVGSGAVGSYYGALLAASGQEVHFLMRADLEAVRRNGLAIRRPEGDLLIRPANAHGRSEEIGPCDLVIVALKATANTRLPELIPPLLKEETLLLTLQNGLGNGSFLSRHFGAERVLGALCFICLNRIEPGVIQSFYPGYLVVGEQEGPPRERTHRLAEMWKAAGVSCRVAESLGEARWRKLCWNVPFNGLAIAAGGIDTQAILAQPRLKKLAEALMKEVQAIARAAGHEIEDAFLERQFTVTYPMGPYRPSSLIDYQLGREVEVEAIWGEPLRQADRLGVDIPCLRTLYALLVSLCGRKEPPQGDGGQQHTTETPLGHAYCRSPKSAIKSG